MHSLGDESWQHKQARNYNTTLVLVSTCTEKNEGGFCKLGVTTEVECPLALYLSEDRLSFS